MSEQRTAGKPVVQRYDLVTNYRCGSSIEEMERADNGEWVRYDDVVAAIGDLAAQLTAAETWYPCTCGAEHDTPKCPFGAGVPA